MENFPPIPENESARIEKLQYYHILDTEAEAVFDDLTKLAAKILDVPICTLTLIDEHRQWFKSSVGAKSQEAPREITFCQYAIMEEDFFEVKDASKDPRFKDNPFVTADPGLRFYLGAPLRDEDGHAIGSFCVQDLKPREFTDEQRMQLKLIANTVMRLIQLRRDKLEVEKLTAVKDEFISNMSHEIRTPLNAIIGFNDLLKKTPLNEEQTNYLNTISITTHNLKNIINDVLDVSKLEGNKIELEEKPLSIAELVQHIIKLQSPNAKAKDLKLLSSLDFELPNYVLGDETRISQILNNLVGNAIKFTQSGSVELRVMVSSVIDDSIAISFEVKDTGIGIASEKMQKIFERFEQAETDTTRLYGGTGLGLSIVKKLVALHGSEIVLKSEEGEGSSFSFTIAFKVCTDAPSKTFTNNQTSVENLFKDSKILVVEDNFHNQLLAKSYFKRWGTEITIAENGELALETLLKNDFDIVLMDLQMPKMNGFVAAGKIRKELKLSIPIIGCSAYSKTSEQIKCLEAGMDDYITKPYSEEELIQTTLKYLKVSGKDLGISSVQVDDFDDFSSLIKDLRTSLGEEVVGQAQEYFLTRTPLDIQEIESSIDNRDMDLLENMAHYIAGTFGALKFTKGCELAKKTERTIKSGKTEDGLVLAKRLMAHLRHAINCFEQNITV